MRRAQKYAGFVSGVVIVCLIVFAITRQRAVRSEASAMQEETRLDTFDRVVAEGTIPELFSFARQLDDNRGHDVPIRIERFNQRISLGKQILELAEIEADRDRGEKMLLTTRLELEKLYQSNGLANSLTRDQLKSLATLSLDSDNPDIRKLAHNSINFISVARIFEAENRSGIKTPLNLIRNSYEKLAGSFPDDPSIPNSLIKFSRDLKTAKIDNDGDKELLNLTIELFGGNAKEEIQKTVSEARQLLRKSTYEIAANEQQMVRLQRDLIKKTVGKANRMFADLQAGVAVTDQTYLNVINCVMMVMQTGHPHVAKDLLNKSQRYFDGENVPAKSRVMYDNLIKIVDTFGKTLKVTQAFNQLTESGIPTLILFTSPNSVAVLDEKISEIGDFSSLLHEDGKLNCIVVHLHDDGTDDQLGELERILQRYPAYELVQTTAEETAEFKSAFPISWMPTWAVLDKDANLASLSSPLPILEMQVLNLMDEETPATSSAD